LLPPTALQKRTKKITEKPTELSSRKMSNKTRYRGEQHKLDDSEIIQLTNGFYLVNSLVLNGHLCGSR